LGRALGARRGGLAAGLGIGAYAILVGGDASVVRAAIMGGLSLLALRLGRTTHALASLSAAAIVMTAVRPASLWEAGFQLSFAATLGLVVYGAPLQAWLARESQRLLPKHQSERVARLLSEYGLYTLAAIVTTFPLTSLLFGRFSLVTLAANPVILPAQPAVMVFGGLAVLLGMVWIPLGQAVAWIAWPFAAFTNRAVEFFAGLPLGDLAVGRFSPAMAIGYYACLALATLWFKIPADRRPRLKLPAASAAFGLAGLLAANGLVWRHALDLPDGRLHLTVLDVDGGDAVLIESPSGRFVLMNGGSSPIQLSEAVGVRLPLFARRLDWVVLSATDDSHVAGLDGIEERFSIGAVLVAGPPGSRAFQSWIGKAAEAGLPLVPAEAGHALDLGDGARLEVAALGERGAILRATYGLASVVMNSVGEPGLVMDLAQQQGIPPATALLLADGGELATNPPPWIQHLSPWVALISVSAGNPRGLPSPELLAVLDGTTVLRTDVNGWIELTTDGERLWVEVERAVE
jgi:competence protein ComEC